MKVAFAKSADSPLSNGLNILPSYTDYFQLTPATTGLQTASVFIGGVFAGLSWGFVTDKLGRRVALFWVALNFLKLLGEHIESEVCFVWVVGKFGHV